MKTNTASHPHPSELLTEYLATHIINEGVNVRECIERGGIDGDVLLDTIFGVLPITEETAAALERLFGRPAHFFLNFQANYDRYIAEHGHNL